MYEYRKYLVNSKCELKKDLTPLCHDYAQIFADIN